MRPQRRRLAGARRAEQREELAAPDVETHRVDSGDLAEAACEVDEADVDARRVRRLVLGRHGV
jgi:hypothetical protein